MPEKKLPEVARMRARKIARMKYEDQTNDHLLKVAVFKEIMRFFAAGRVAHETQRAVIAMCQEEIEDRELYGDNYIDWEGGYRARLGKDD